MIVPGTLASNRQVFISFSSKDLKPATTICHAIESRGVACWISNRDVRGGENFQEAIISAIHAAKIMVLVFSSNTNNSGEIKKELALASQNGLVVIPVRIEDVLPSGAFAYELSTRQWVNLFQDWDVAMEGLTGRIASVLGTSDGPSMPETPARAKENAATADARKPADEETPRSEPPKSRRMPLIAGALATCVALLGGGFYYYRHIDCCTLPPAALPSVHPPEAAAAGTAERERPTVIAPQPHPIEAADKTPAASNSETSQKREQPQVAETKAASVVASLETTNTDASPAPVAIAPKDQSRAPEIPVGPPPKIAAIGTGGQVFKECANCPAMVAIPAGTNWIGSASSQSGHDSSEEPRREVHFKQPFAIGRDAVTYAEWDACVADGGCNHFLPGDMGWGRGQQPVVLVSWDDAKAYTAWLSQKTGATYRLPFEAEWEYAARACILAICQDQIFWFGNRISPDRANYDWRYSYAGSQKAQALGKPKPAGTDGPNAFGLFNAVGNVSQWVEDCWNDNLKTLPADGSARLTGDCSSRVFRGGSWHDEPVDLRSASRKSDLSNSRQPFIGFRVARVLVE